MSDYDSYISSDLHSDSDDNLSCISSELSIVEQSADAIAINIEAQAQNKSTLLDFAITDDFHADGEQSETLSSNNNNHNIHHHNSHIEYDSNNNDIKWIDAESVTDSLQNFNDQQSILSHFQDIYKQGKEKKKKTKTKSRKKNKMKSLNKVHTNNNNTSNINKSRNLKTTAINTKNPKQNQSRLNMLTKTRNNLKSNKKCFSLSPNPIKQFAKKPAPAAIAPATAPATAATAGSRAARGDAVWRSGHKLKKNALSLDKKP
jgi:hypothetical protein